MTTIATIHDGYTVTVDPRPPRKGEIGWFVSPTDTRAEMIAKVIEGREDEDTGAHGFGWVAWKDFPEGIDEGGDIAITVRVEHAP